MTYTADPRVDAYIATLPTWQQAICLQVRRDETMNKQAFLALIQAVVTNNRGGGWRKV